MPKKFVIIITNAVLLTLSIEERLWKILVCLKA